jgi:hypothetical protein
MKYPVNVERLHSWHTTHKTKTWVLVNKQQIIQLNLKPYKEQVKFEWWNLKLKSLNLRQAVRLDKDILEGWGCDYVPPGRGHRTRQREAISKRQPNLVGKVPDVVSLYSEWF